MAQTYASIAGTDKVKDSRTKITDRDEALRSDFSGTAFPTDPAPVVGQRCRRTDLGLTFTCVSTGPDVWCVNVINRKGSDVASAGTVNLDSVAGDFCHVTGTTTITGATLAVGREMLVVFDGNTSLTHSSTFIMPDGANLAVKAGDCAVFRGEGSSTTRLVGLMRVSAGIGKINVRGSDIASASTLNLEASAGDMADVTGTTTVTAVTLGDGKRFLVRFTGALVLTHSSNLVLPTAANITTAAGDYALFVSYGSTVRLAFYQRANGKQLYALTKADIDAALGKTAMRVNAGTNTNSGLFSWGSSDPGTLHEGELYGQHA